MNHRSHHSLATVWRNTWWTNRPKIGTFSAKINPCCWEFAFSLTAKQFYELLQNILQNKKKKPFCCRFSFHTFCKPPAKSVFWGTKLSNVLFLFEGNIVLGLQTNFYEKNFRKKFWNFFFRNADRSGAWSGFSWSSLYQVILMMMLHIADFLYFGSRFYMAMWPKLEK